MSDAADMAQTFESQHRDTSLNRPARADGPPAVIIDGVACCTECEEPIPPARLKALPGVGLCVSCQQSKESERMETERVDIEPEE